MKGVPRVFILTGLFLLGLLGAPNSKVLTPCSPTLRLGDTSNGGAFTVGTGYDCR